MDDRISSTENFRQTMYSPHQPARCTDFQLTIAWNPHGIRTLAMWYVFYTACDTAARMACHSVDLLYFGGQLLLCQLTPFHLAVNWTNLFLKLYPNPRPLGFPFPHWKCRNKELWKGMLKWTWRQVLGWRGTMIILLKLYCIDITKNKYTTKPL